MPTQADIYVAYLHQQIGEPYVWGDEGPDTHDCSGLYWEGMHEAGVQWRGHNFPRMTANDYYHMGVTVPKPELVGADTGHIVSSSGHSYHIIPFVGYDQNGVGWTIEARGRKWGVVKYRLDDPINGALKRKAKWRRLPVNLGTLTPSGGDDMNDEQNQWLKELRQMVAPQSSYREAIMVSLSAGLYDEALRLNNEFYQKWPTGVSGLPKDWRPGTMPLGGDRG